MQETAVASEFSRWGDPSVKPAHQKKFCQNPISCRPVVGTGDSHRPIGGESVAAGSPPRKSHPRIFDTGRWWFFEILDFLSPSPPNCSVVGGGKNRTGSRFHPFPIGLGVVSTPDF